MSLSLINRRGFLAHVTAGAATLAVSSLSRGESSSPPGPRPARGRGPLRTGRACVPSPPPGSIRPEGWLHRQLRLQADGLSGHLDEFWPDVGQSQWFGGKAEGWERAPYWLDGVIPLAWILGTRPSSPRSNATSTTSSPPRGLTAGMPVSCRRRCKDLRPLVHYSWPTRCSCSTTRLLPMRRCSRPCSATSGRPWRPWIAPPCSGWGQMRWFEGLIPVYYAYERTGEPWLLTWPTNCTTRVSTTWRSTAVGT